jgi:hypothetical protein
MNLTVAYWKRSAIVSNRLGLAISLAPNLRRDRVSFVGTLRQPLRFREAVSALHDVVISDCVPGRTGKTGGGDSQGRLS